MGIINYINETRAEMKHTTWPTRKEAAFYTVFVIVSSLLLAAFLGAFDSLFSQILKNFI
ncbi:MAG: preprotein translocase subunit SecE [Candidatus Pacebacteria bacterium]|nr:preprotein translocase subunit SecE [Candidatus Paceibacterota bacterium]